MEVVLLMGRILVVTAMKVSLVDIVKRKFRVACVFMEDAFLGLFASVKWASQENYVKYQWMTLVPRCHVETVPVLRKMGMQDVYVTLDTLALFVM